jgi:hypothetical protein
MKKPIAFILCIMLLFFSSCKKTEPATTPTEEIIIIDENYVALHGQAYIDDLFNKKYSEAYENYPHDKAMKNAVDPEKYESFFVELYEKYGSFLKYAGNSVELKGNYFIYSVGAVFESGELNVNAVFDKEGLLAGLNFGIFTFEKDTPVLGLKEIDIEFGTEPWILKGKITTPEEEGKYPLLILVHGSGPNDMNETVGLNTPFKDIGEYLPKKGVAVLRYDKRTYTYGAEMAALKELTVYEETIQDVAEAIKYAKTLDFVDEDNIFVLGHSLGAYLIPRIASETPDAKGYIMAAGMFSTLGDLISYQLDYLALLDGEITQEEQAQIDIMKEQAFKTLKAHLINDDEAVLGAYKAYWEYLADYNPSEEAKIIEKPVLVIQGERDYQVPVDEYYKIYEEMKDYDNFKFKLYLGVNHILIQGEGTPSPEEYYTQSKVYQPLMDDIADFIVE